MAVRVVSLPATASRMKNGPSSWGASMSSPTSACTSADVRSSVGSARRASASSFISIVSWTPAWNIAAPMSSVPAISGSPAPRITLVADSTVENSLRGIPIMSQITSSGNGWEIACTRSTSPFSHMSSMTSAQIRSTDSVSWARRRGVNERATMPRCRACRGSSMAMNEPKNSSASAGMSMTDTEPRPEQKSCGRRLISTTSA